MTNLRHNIKNSNFRISCFDHDKMVKFILKNKFYSYTLKQIKRIFNFVNLSSSNSSLKSLRIFRSVQPSERTASTIVPESHCLAFRWRCRTQTGGILRLLPSSAFCWGAVIWLSKYCYFISFRFNFLNQFIYFLDNNVIHKT